MTTSPISRAVEIVGLQPLSKALGVTYQAIRKWEAMGRLPRTEWTGETSYASTIQQLTGGQVSIGELLDLRKAKNKAA